VSAAEPGPKPRRFYKKVSVKPAGEGFGLRLDGRTAKTPGGAPLSAPTGALAAVMAAEWERQGDKIDYVTMPVTRLAFTAIDRTPSHRAGLAEEVSRYAGSDLLCYLAEAPASLVERETELWAPWLAWAETALGVSLRISAGVAPTTQDVAALALVRRLSLELADFPLTGLAFAAGLYGSAVLAFAVQRGEISALDAYELSRLEEAFQEQRWGVDEEAALRTNRLRGEAVALGLWFAALER
jgi:chaperone required for assembly of F1-ATPase